MTRNRTRVGEEATAEPEKGNSHSGHCQHRGNAEPANRSHRSDITARLELSSCRQGGREHGEGEGEAAKAADGEGDVAPRAEVRPPVQAEDGEDADGGQYDQEDD